MDIREASNLIIFEDTFLGGTVLKTEREHIVAVTGECGGIYIPDDFLKQYKTRFFRIQVNQDELILSPVKVQLEVVEVEEKFPIVQDKSQGGKSQ